MSKRKSWRKIHFGEEEVWRWKYGKSGIAIYDSNNKLHYVPFGSFYSQEDLEDQYYCWEGDIDPPDVPITPKKIRSYIEENLRNKVESTN